MACVSWASKPQFAQSTSRQGQLRQNCWSGSTEIWTRIAGFRVLSANHYTMEPCLFSKLCLRLLYWQVFSKGQTCSTREQESYPLANKQPCFSFGKKKLPPPGGLEPPTFRLTAERASQLRHGGFSDRIATLDKLIWYGLMICKTGFPRSGQGSRSLKESNWI